ncbi:hypothetical protein HK096_006427, partial [Nowakowskiella sp. JEL0078]
MRNEYSGLVGFLVSFPSRLLTLGSRKSAIANLLSGSSLYFAAVVDYNLALNYADSEENSLASSTFDNVYSIKVLAPVEADPLYILISIDALNQLAILKTSVSDNEKALSLLKHAASLATNFDPIAVPIIDPLEAKPPLAEAGRARLDELYTYTLYYLAQVYGVLNDPVSSAACCLETLQRQLCGKTPMVARAWALDAMTLAQYYMQKENFSLAFQCLTAAETLLEGGGETDDEDERRANADLMWVWARFWVAMLATSVDRLGLVEEEEGIVLFEGVDFKTRWMGLCKNEKDANAAFVAALQSLESAKAFFILDGWVTDHVQLILLTNTLYKNLLPFTSTERRAKIHKRRVDMLTRTAADLNPTGDVSGVHTRYVGLVRAIAWEAAITWEILVEMEMDNKKRNEFALQGIKAFLEVVQTFVDRRTSRVMEPVVDADDSRLLMTSRWRMARLYSTLIPLAGNKHALKVGWLKK